MTYSKEILSGSTNGLPIKVVATATVGTTIHTAPAGTTGIDNVTIYAHNIHTADVLLSIELGEATMPIKIVVPMLTGLTLVLPDLPINNGKVITAFAATANVICLTGTVNRITA